MAEEVKTMFTLPKVKVIVKPILRDGVWLDKGHSGNWQYDNCFFGITVPLDKNTGYLKEVLTKEEREFFESPESGLSFKQGDLAATKREGNFWKNYTIPIQKPEAIVKDETELFSLDLSKPFDYIKYKVMLANTSVSGGHVAPSWGERFNSGTYKIALVQDKETLTDIVSKSEKRQEAYKYLGVLQKSTEDMYDCLSIYWLNSKSYNQPPKDSTKDFYTGEIEKIIQSDLDGFVAIVRDKDNYPIKVLIHKAVRLNVVSFSISEGFVTKDRIPLGLTLGDAVSFLKNPKNQEHYFRIENYVKMNEK